MGAAHGPPRIGVLFVHGIGQQEQGGTLTRWGDSLLGWLRHWLGDQAVTVDRATLVPTGEDAGAPAHVDAQIAFPTDPAAGDPGDAPPVSVRIAEGWWANAFPPPTFSELATWGTTVLPTVALSHLVAALSRRWRQLREATGPVAWIACTGRLLGAASGVVLGAALSPFLVAAVLLMLLLGAIPVPMVQRVAAAVQRVLAASVGDSYVLLDSPTRQAAITSQVERSLRWLQRHCDQVVVVAHSQGAAVAHDLLWRRRPATVARLLTFGSGLAKLATLREVRGSDKPGHAWAASFGLLLVAVSVQPLLAALRTGSDDAWGMGWVGLFGLLLLAIAAWELRPRPLPAAALDVGIPWLDVYSTHDPVPAGPLPVDDGSIVTSRRVVNLASHLRDHNAYWAARDEFLPLIAAEIAAAADRGIDPLGPFDAAVRTVAGRRRAWRVGWLRAARVVALGSAVVLPLRMTDRLQEVGGRLLDAVNALSVLPLWDGRLTVAAPAGLAAVGTATLVAAAGLGYAAAAGAWRAWDAEETSRMLRRGAYPLLSGPSAVFLAAVLALPVVAVAAPGLRPDWAGLSLRAVALPVVMFALIVMLRLPVAPLLRRLERAGVLRPGSLQHPTVDLGIALAASLAIVAGDVLGAMGAWLALGLVVGPPVLAVVVVPVVTGWRGFERLIAALRVAAWAQPPAVAALRVTPVQETPALLVSATAVLEERLPDARAAVDRAEAVLEGRGRGEEVALATARRRVTGLVEEARTLASTARQIGLGDLARTLERLAEEPAQTRRDGSARATPASAV